MNEDIWLKENKTGEDLLLCLQNCIEEEHWFEINERNSKVLFNYITNLKQALIDIKKECKLEAKKGTFDTNDDEMIANEIAKEKFNNILQITDKVLGE